MTQLAFVNGRFVPRAEAMVSIDDRGMLFADSVYEVVLVADGRPVDLEGHLARLERSMQALAFPPMKQDLPVLIAELLRRNDELDAAVYLQVSRGVAPRDLNASAGLIPSLVMTSRPHAIPPSLDPEGAVDIVVLPDQRWGRCDIKTTALVAGVLARIRARESGAADAWLVDSEGFVTEGCASNAWIVRDGRLLTRAAGPEILAGITRERMMALAASAGIGVEERRFAVKEAVSADEAFMTSATALITAVRSIDGTPINGGEPGPITLRLYDAYVAFARGG